MNQTTQLNFKKDYSEAEHVNVKTFVTRREVANTLKVTSDTHSDSDCEE